MVCVTGTVQGVGFREFVRRTADALGVSGEVWNAPDGSVRAVAEHRDELELFEFIRRLKEGPGEVEEVDYWPGSPINKQGFAVGISR